MKKKCVPAGHYDSATQTKAVGGNEAHARCYTEGYSGDTVLRYVTNYENIFQIEKYMLYKWDHAKMT